MDGAALYKSYNSFYPNQAAIMVPMKMPIATPNKNAGPVLLFTTVIKLAFHADYLA